MKTAAIDAAEPRVSAQDQADAAITRPLLAQLASQGRYALIRELQKYRSSPVPIDDLAVRHLHTGPRRQLVYPELLSMLEQDTATSGKLLKLLSGAEFMGRLGDLRRAMQAAHAQIRAEIAAFDPARRNIASTLRLAYLLHDMEAVEAITALDLPDEASDAIRSALETYRALFAHCGLDPADVERNVAALRDGRTLRFDRPTVVFRTSTYFWDTIAEPRPIEEMSSVTFLDMTKAVRELGLDVAVIPQMGNAGPAYVAPFAMDDPNFVCSIAYHKYCYTLSPKFISYRKYLWDRFTLDFGGYSGWMHMPEMATLVAERDAAAATEFCDAKREAVFAQWDWPEGIPQDKPFLFIPLQLQADSVEALAFSHPEEMIAACARHFLPLGWNMVIKRHPKDVNAETADLVARAIRTPGVYEAFVPSPQLIKASSAVAVVNSSVGWEAVLAHKPILSFGASEYSQVTQLVHSDVDLSLAPLSLSPEDRTRNDILYHYFAVDRMLPGRAALNGALKAMLEDVLSGKPIRGY